MKTIIHAITLRNWTAGVLFLFLTAFPVNAFADLTGQSALQAPDPEANDNCGTSLGTASLTTTASAQAASQLPESIPMSELGAKAGAQYQGDGLSVMPMPDGALLRCVFQKLEGLVTLEGLWLTSTAESKAGEKFRVMAHAVGRAGALKTLPSQGTVGVADKLARLVRPDLTEEYSVSVDGVRQDFVVAQRPAGDGALRVELDVTGAKAEALVNGARLVLAGSGRKIAYNRLRVVDAGGKELIARMEVKTETRLAVLVEDATATYPVRIDPTFSDADWISLGGILGVGGLVYATAVDGSGNLYIGGGFTAAGDVFANNIAKWNGSAWLALDSGVNGSVFALAVSGSDLYVGGSFTDASGSGATRVAKWDGSAWLALGSGLSAVVNALAVSGTNLYVGGSFTLAGGSGATNVAKWNGSAWSALGSGLDSSAKALAVSGTNLYVGGIFTTAGGIAANRVAKWNGSAWSALGTVNGFAANVSVNALAVSDTNLYVGGDFISVTNTGGVTVTVNNVAKWNGSAWSALGSGVDAAVFALVVSGNDLYVGGDFFNAGGSSALGVAKWNGSVWSAFGTGASGVKGLAVSGGNVYAGGSFTTAGGIGVSRVAKWNGSAWSALGSGLNNLVSALAVSDTNLYVGGEFITAGGIAANRVAKWNGSVWSALGSGLNSSVSALAVSGTNLYVGGSFTTAGGNNATNVAKWNGNAWSALGSGVNGSVAALAVSDTNLYVGGNFTMAGGSGATNVAKWNGSAWSALSSGIGGVNPFVRALAVSGTNLYVGGFFSTAGGIAANRVAKWNGSAWSALGSGLWAGFASSDVKSLAVSGSDLYVGGFFTTATNTGNVVVTVNNVAKWNGSAWSALGAGVGSAATALAVLGSDLYVGGDFILADGNTITVNRVAKWDGSAWSELGSGVDNSVSAMAVSGDALYVGGLLTTAGDKVSAYVAKANLAGTISAAPIITSISMGFGFVDLECLGTPDLFYDILRADDDINSSWNIIDTQVAAPDGSFFSTDYNPPVAGAFYRLREQ